MGSMDIKDLLLIGGAAAGVYFLTRGNNNTQTSGNVLPNWGIGGDIQKIIDAVVPQTNPYSSTSSTPLGYPQVATGIIDNNGNLVPSTSTNWLPSWGIGGDIQNGLNSLNGAYTWASDLLGFGPKTTDPAVSPPASVVMYGTAGNNAQDPIMQNSEAASIASGQTILGTPIGTYSPPPTYTAAYIATLPSSGTIGGGTPFQSGNGGYNTGIKYF